MQPQEGHLEELQPEQHPLEFDDGFSHGEPILHLADELTVDPTDPCRIYAGTVLNGLLAFTKSGAAGCE